jgi:hypothetical protein
MGKRRNSLRCATFKHDAFLSIFCPAQTAAPNAEKPAEKAAEKHSEKHVENPNAFRRLVLSKAMPNIFPPLFLCVSVPLC